MSRNIIEVINQIKPLVTEHPEVSTKTDNLIKRYLPYTAPEMMHLRWNQLQEILLEEVGLPTLRNYNSIKVWSIFSTVPEKDIVQGLKASSKDTPGTTDEVGGYHDSGIGWNPNGVWCGECARGSCKGCPNENNVEDEIKEGN